MSASRYCASFVGFALLLAAGCDNKSTSGGGGATGDGYGKKLVGVWEGEPDAKDDKKMDAASAEFKADGTCKLGEGPFAMNGKYTVTKEDGKVVSLDIEMPNPFADEKDKDKLEKKSFTATFEDADTVTITPTDKAAPKKMKRKK